MKKIIAIAVVGVLCSCSEVVEEKPQVIADIGSNIEKAEISPLENNVELKEITSEIEEADDIVIENNTVEET